jgi:transketolase
MTAASPDTKNLATAVRALSIDAVEAAVSGHPGMPLGAADIATVLYAKVLKFDAAAPEWPDRDRFVLSAGHASAMLYALTYLTGYPDMTIEQVRDFRQMGSLTPGHPEIAPALGVEMTTGPLGQGLGAAVGMAIAERLLNARYGDDLVDHRTWVLAGDGDLMEGLSQEAISLAGALRLNRLVVLYDENHISIDGSTDLTFLDNTPARFEACGWRAESVDGHDPDALEAAMKRARKSDLPSIICCRTRIGLGSPAKEDKAAAHAGALGAEDTAATKAALGWTHPPFEVPDDLLAEWRQAGKRCRDERQSWEKRLASAKAETRDAFNLALSGALPENLGDLINAVKKTASAEKPVGPTRQMSGRALEALVPAIPALIGGSADLTPANNTFTEVSHAISAGNFAGNYIHYGVREHAMAAAMNGLAIHGGFIPYGGSFLIFTDYCRPALRLAALMEQRIILVMTHDSIGLGEDGPTHQPVEQLAALRAMPNVRVFRPADAVEAAECWQLALECRTGPSVMSLSRQAVETLRLEHTDANRSAAGAYVLAAADGAPDATLIATGGEVMAAMKARELLQADGLAIRVVSMPCRELFDAQTVSARDKVLGTGLRVGIEAAAPFGWSDLLGNDGMFIGVRGFGASAPDHVLFDHFGLSPNKIAEAVKARLG